MSVRDSCALFGAPVSSYYRWRQGVRRKKPLEQGSDRFQAILKAATPLFLNEGMAATTDMIARSAGVSRQTLFNAIGSKERLFRLVVVAIQGRLFESLPKLKSGCGLQNGLTDFGRQYLATAFDPEGIALNKLLIAEARHFPDLTKYGSALGAALAASILSGYFLEEMSAGRLKRFDPDYTAESFLSAVVGRARAAVLLGEPVDPAHVREERLHNTVAVFVAALSVDP